MWPWSRGAKQPDFKQQVAMQTLGNIRESEATSPDVFQPAQFDSKILDDEKILALFSPESSLFCPLLVPLLPLVSRLNWLSNDSPQEARAFKLSVDTQITRLKNRATSPEEFMLLDSLKSYLHQQINNSINGFKIRVLSESRRILSITEENQSRSVWPWKRK